MRPLRVSDEPSLLGKLISALLVRIGLKKKQEPEIVAIHPERTPFNRAKTLTEKKIKEKKIAPAQVEGLMKDDDRVETENIMQKKPRKVKKKLGKRKSSKKKK